MPRPKQDPEALRQQSSAYSSAYRKKYMAIKPGESMALLNSMALRTREEVGRILLCSQQNVGQIERRALHKIRRRLQHLYVQLKQEKG